LLPPTKPPYKHYYGFSLTHTPPSHKPSTYSTLNNPTLAYLPLCYIAPTTSPPFSPKNEPPPIQLISNKSPYSNASPMTKNSHPLKCKLRKNGYVTVRSLIRVGIKAKTSIRGYLTFNPWGQGLLKGKALSGTGQWLDFQNFNRIFISLNGSVN